MEDPNPAPGELQVPLVPMRRLHTTPAVGTAEEGPSLDFLDLNHSMTSVAPLPQLVRHPSMEPPKPKKRLISRPELLRHSSRSLLKMLSSSSLIENTESASEEHTCAQEEGVLLLYITGWGQPHLHHRVAGGTWSTSPGVPMTRVLLQTPHGRALIGLLPRWLRGPAEGKLWFFASNTPNLEFLPNDGHGGWDKAPGCQHYYAGTKGKYALYRGSLQRLPDPPQKPAVLRCIEAGSSHACLTWNPNPFKAETISGYTIYRDGQLVAMVDGDCRDYTDRPLLGLRVYSYFVCAVNPEGQEGPPSDCVLARTSEPGKPSAPLNLVCINRTENRLGQANPYLEDRLSLCHRIEICWKPPADHGGAPVRFYRVYKDGVPIAFLPAVGPQEHKYTDVAVTKGDTHRYTVSAWHDLPPPDYNEGKSNIDYSRSNGFFRIFLPAAVEGLHSDPLDARAETRLEGPRLDDGKGHIMLQGFNWVSAQNPTGWYNVLCSKLEDIKRLGVSIIWCPPPTECVGLEGYMPTRWYSLNSHYGTAAELQHLIRTARESGLACCVDLVANHRCGTRQDSRGHWTIFEAPDWGPWAVVCNNLQGYHGEGGKDTGVSVDCAPDLDHTNPQVQRDMKLWTQWLMRDVGYLAFRIDMAGGYAPQYQARRNSRYLKLKPLMQEPQASFYLIVVFMCDSQQAFVEHLGRPFTVGEYWHGDTRALVNYVRAAGGSLAAFDFAFYYHLQRAVETGDFGILNACGNLNGLVGIVRTDTQAWVDSEKG
ncbi:alpha catalytic domain-containing protein [Cyclospora cayetanensis]|uniref:Alpha catalytic domain-containing protein n=1 Tax=Cyclospora cayetanensis TaxID=88456 RepID=A0A1D3D394_9EIME|nr:alpha catalytic domain-containing protein [Cyclospora cayetanensis]